MFCSLRRFKCELWTKIITHIWLNAYNKKYNKPVLYLSEQNNHLVRRNKSMKVVQIIWYLIIQEKLYYSTNIFKENNKRRWISKYYCLLIFLCKMKTIIRNYIFLHQPTIPPKNKVGSLKSLIYKDHSPIFNSRLFRIYLLANY